MTNFKHYMIERALWNLACDHNHVDHAAMFVVFTQDNPWSGKLNNFLLSNNPTFDAFGYFNNRSRFVSGKTMLRNPSRD